MNKDSLKHESKKQRAAFTLIEMIVVIAIITLLAVLTVGGVNRALARSRGIKCMSNLRQISLAIYMHVEENHGRLPRPTIKASDPDRPVDPRTGEQVTSSLMWSKQLSVYLPSPHGSLLTSRQGPTFNCPNARYQGISNSEIGSSYLCTAALFHFPTPTHGGSGTSGPARLFSTIYRPSSTILVTDGKQRGTGNSCLSNLSWSGAETDLSRDTPEQTENLDFRHPGDTIHQLYADGSVRQMRFTDRESITRSMWEGRNH